MKNDVQDNPGVIAPPPLIYAGTLIAGFLLNRAIPVKLSLPRSLRFMLGAAFIGTAIVLVRSAFSEMQRANTSINPTQPTVTIVTEGPYRFTRNPIYLFFTLFYSGIVLIANALWAFLLLPIVLLVINRGVIDREERYLEQKFGDQYLDYKEHVRRWL